jgi:hypothetical protein
VAAAARRGIERDGGDAAAVSFWHLWMAELPFMADSGLGHGRTLSRRARQAFLTISRMKSVIAEADSRSPTP